ncbi:hypothetical protein HED55_12510 [Ochrobactrum haematophilum]|uniref:Uncharacterized protein n=1 Tax=Brucella haematophila TaxID=419474 RepID=A0ABX1DSK8_9HYPH|nr:hypothetical protein [Brucella haematophila]
MLDIRGASRADSSHRPEHQPGNNFKNRFHSDILIWKEERCWNIYNIIHIIKIHGTPPTKPYKFIIYLFLTTAISIVSNLNNQFTMKITFKETAKIQNENPSAYKHKRTPTIYLSPESSPF